MRIARVFPSKTSMCPQDKDSYFGLPDFFTPQYDEIHISVTFTWDIQKAYVLKGSWNSYGKVIMGGVAISGESNKPMVSGMYLKKGITITSRGCNNNCSFCMVRNGLIELDTFPEGNIIQDNNILACSDKHRRKVWSMLSKQQGIEFNGGLEKSRITPKIAKELRSLSIKTLWLACDQPNATKSLAKAVHNLTKVGFTRSHLYCYALCGKDMQEEEERMKEIWKIGCMPFAQLYKNKDDSMNYSRQWKQFARRWSRPAIIRSRMKQP